jgi:hypothetical protein
VEQFAPRADFHALVVQKGDQWVAALPLVSQRMRRLLSAGRTPSNEWALSGELLLDAATGTDDVLGVLVAAMGDLPWQLVWLDIVPIDAPRWKALHRAFGRAGLPTGRGEHERIGRIEIDHDWEGYKRRWSHKHRQQMARAARRLAALGDVQFAVHSQLAPEQVEFWLRRGFEVEDRSWKGEAGSSVLRTPGMFRFLVRQARQLASWGQLELAFLELDGCAVAFNYGMRAKGVYHSYKSGYDPQYAAFSPGNLLRYRVLQRLYAQSDCRAVDFMGPLTAAIWKWKPASYVIGREVVAPRRLLGRVALHAYERWWRRARGLRGKRELGAATRQSG